MRRSPEHLEAVAMVVDHLATIIAAGVLNEMALEVLGVRSDATKGGSMFETEGPPDEVEPEEGENGDEEEQPGGDQGQAETPTG